MKNPRGTYFNSQYKPNYNIGTQRKRRRTRKAPKDVPVPVKEYVQKAIHSNLENKQYTTEIAKTMSNFSNGTNFQSGNIFQLTPSSGTNALYTIVQGTGEASRIGNQIRTRKVMIRFCMYPQVYNITSNPTPKPQDVVMYIFSIKKSVLGSTVLDAYNVLNTTFYSNGSTSNGMLGTLYDLVSVPNNETVNVYYTRKFKLSASNAQLQTGASGAFSNNDYKYNIQYKLNITKYFPKRITFNDTDNNSTSNQLFCVFAPLNADGTGTASTVFPASIFFGLDFYFEDS